MQLTSLRVLTSLLVLDCRHQSKSQVGLKKVRKPKSTCAGGSPCCPWSWNEKGTYLLLSSIIMWSHSVTIFTQVAVRMTALESQYESSLQLFLVNDQKKIISILFFARTGFQWFKWLEIQNNNKLILFYFLITQGIFYFLITWVIFCIF